MWVEIKIGISDLVCRYTFCMAPVDLKKQTVKAWFRYYATQYSQLWIDGRIDLDSEDDKCGVGSGGGGGGGVR